MVHEKEREKEQANQYETVIPRAVLSPWSEITQYDNKESVRTSVCHETNR